MVPEAAPKPIPWGIPRVQVGNERLLQSRRYPIHGHPLSHWPLSGCGKLHIALELLYASLCLFLLPMFVTTLAYLRLLNPTCASLMSSL